MSISESANRQEGILEAMRNASASMDVSSPPSSAAAAAAASAAAGDTTDSRSSSSSGGAVPRRTSIAGKNGP